MSHYVVYYENQTGGGARIANIGVPYTRQRGHGIGSFLGGSMRTILPIIGRMLQPVGKELLTAGTSVFRDVISRRSNLKNALEKRLTESGQRLKQKAMTKFEEMLHQRGNGYKRKLRSNSAQKGKGSPRVKRFKQLGTGRKKKCQKIEKKKKKTSRKKQRTVYDIFDK